MKKMKIVKVAVALAVVLTIVFSSVISASACTGFYLGEDLTESGSVIWGRSEDVSASYSKLHVVVPAATHEPGEMFVEERNGVAAYFKYPYPEQTLRYTIVKDSALNEGYTPEPYGEVGMNEKNVALSGTVSLSGAKAAISHTDAFVTGANGGLTERVLASIVLMQATSARHAIEILAAAVDTYGSAERNGITVSDPDEVWYMEILSGHQYVAVKAPSDKVGYSPNITMMGAVDVTDTENVVASPGLISVAEAAETAVYNEDGHIKVAESYANSNSTVNNRMWQGYYYLKGEDAANALEPGYFEYYTDPREEAGYTLYEAMRLLAYRGEGTDRDAGNNASNSYGIGNDRTVEAHVFETREDMPAALATVQWFTMGPAEFSVYLPSYGSQITETYEKYWATDSSSYNENSMYWVFRQLYTECKKDRENYGANVKLFWEGYQKKLIEQQKAIDEDMAKIYAYDPDLAGEKATALAKCAAEEAYTYALQMLNELQAFIAEGSDGAFVPSVLTGNVQPGYTLAAVGGTGLPYTRTEEFDQNILFSGGWKNVDSSKFSSRRARQLSKAGDSVSFTIEGSAFRLISYASASQGIISVSVDGQLMDTVDLYTPSYDVGFGYTAYENKTLVTGKHTVTITVAGKNAKSTGYSFYLDAVDVEGTVIPCEAVVSDSVYIMENADPATVVSLPAGTEILPTDEGGPLHGGIAINDGKIIYTPTDFAAQDKITYQVGDQTATVTIRKAGLTRYEESFAGYDKTGTWPSYNVASYSGGSAYRSNVKDSAISFTFEGTGFDVISYKSFTRGTFQVVVEDSSGNTVVNEEVDCWDPGADTLFRYPVYKSGTLAKGTYKVTITVKENKNVEFDAVDIYQ